MSFKFEFDRDFITAADQQVVIKIQILGAVQVFYLYMSMIPIILPIEKGLILSNVSHMNKDVCRRRS